MSAIREKVNISERRACRLVGLSRSVLHYDAKPDHEIGREQLALPGAPNEVWPIDFVMDALSNGRRVKCLTVVDDFTKEAVDIVADHGISGLYVARALDRAARFRGYPKAVRIDQGPEFTSRALDQWAYANGVTLKSIQAGKPTQNAYIESSNGKFRDESRGSAPMRVRELYDDGPGRL